MPRIAQTQVDEVSKRCKLITTHISTCGLIVGSRAFSWSIILSGDLEVVDAWAHLDLLAIFCRSKFILLL